MISEKHKTIFIHIPKVAGQSIETMFLNACGLTWDTRDALLLRRKEPGEEGPERLAHLKGKDYFGLGYISKDSFDSYFKFSFVRNPYARAFSFYNFLGYAGIIGFRAFVEEVIPRKLEEKDFFFISQYDYLHDDDGKLLVDFLGRLESIKEDIEVVKQRSGIEDQQLPFVNKSKKGMKRGMGLLSREPYLWKHLRFRRNLQKFEEVYTEELKSKVYNLYRKDFEAFGYDS